MSRWVRQNCVRNADGGFRRPVHIGRRVNILAIVGGVLARRPKPFVPPRDACGLPFPPAEGPRVRSPAAPSQGSRRRRRIVGAQPPGSIPCEGLRLAERQSDASAPRGPFRQPNMSFRSGRSHCQDVTVVLCTSAAGPISISNAIVGGASRPSADISARGCLCERPPLSKAKGSEARSASPRQDLQRRRRRRRDSPPRRRRPLRGDPFKRPREASPAKAQSR